jgi:hypothetical protein
MSEHPTTINFPPTRKRELKLEAANRGVTMEALIVEAFDSYMASKSGKSTPPARSPGKVKASPHQKLHDKLEYILNSVSRDAIEAVTTNINVFHRIAEVDSHVGAAANLEKAG